MLVRALLAFIALPGLVAIVVPPIIASLDPWRVGPARPGLAVMAAGAFVLVWCVRDFFVAGRGTLAPWDPPKSLVLVGLYRHTRNPMYVGVLVLVLGWAMTLGSPALGGYAILLAVAFHLRVLIHEEPWLASQFGPQWHAYAAAVPRWLPRFTPWQDGSS